jgi:hypothetical protein
MTAGFHHQRAGYSRIVELYSFIDDVLVAGGPESGRKYEKVAAIVRPRQKADV